MSKERNEADQALELLARRKLEQQDLASLEAKVEERVRKRLSKPRWRLRLLPTILVLGSSAGLAAAGGLEVARRWIWSATSVDSSGNVTTNTVHDLGTDASGRTTLSVEDPNAAPGSTDSATEITITPASATEDGKKRIEIQLPADRPTEPGLLILRADEVAEDAAEEADKSPD